MRRILPLSLCLLLAAPSSARAAEDTPDAAAKTKKKKKKKTAKPGAMHFDDVAAPGKKKATPVAKPDEKSDEKTDAKADQKTEEKTDEKSDDQDDADDSDDTETAPAAALQKAVRGFPRHRYAYIVGGVALVGGLAFAYSAQGEATRAKTILTAKEASQALDSARASAATSNVMYGLAASALVVALLFELLPERMAEKASLTVHF